MCDLVDRGIEKKGEKAILIKVGLVSVNWGDAAY